MNIKFCEHCGKRLDDKDYYLVTYTRKTPNMPSEEVHIELCSACCGAIKEKALCFSEVDKIVDKVEPLPLLSKDEFTAFYSLVNNYVKNKSKLLKIVMGFSHKLAKRVMVEDVNIDNVAEIAEQWEAEFLG